MRERGVQSRRVRPGGVVPAGRRNPPPPSNANAWQVIAIVALIAATAGWTTVAILAVRDTPGSVAQASPSASVEAGASDDATLPPVADTHDAVEMEVLLPTEWAGSALQAQSWTGDAILGDDASSQLLTKFLTDAGKTTKDLRVGQVTDPTQALDGLITVYAVPGLEAAAVRDALIAAWKIDYPALKATPVTLEGHQVMKVDFGPDAPTSYLYVQGDAVYDIEVSDEALAISALAAIPKPGPSSSGGPAPSRSPSSTAPSRSAVPSASPG